jgi:hypothetical protein
MLVLLFYWMYVDRISRITRADGLVHIKLLSDLCYLCVIKRSRGIGIILVIPVSYRFLILMTSSE